MCPSFNLDRVREFIFFHRFAGGQLRRRRKSAPAHVAAAASGIAAAAAAAATGMDLPAGPEFDRTVAHQLDGLALTGGYWMAAQTSHGLGAATLCKGASCGNHARHFGRDPILCAPIRPHVPAPEAGVPQRRPGRVCVRGVQPRLRSPPQPQLGGGRHPGVQQQARADDAGAGARRPLRDGAGAAAELAAAAAYGLDGCVTVQQDMPATMQTRLCSMVSTVWSAPHTPQFAVCGNSVACMICS